MFQIVGKEQNFKQWDLEQLVTCACLKEGDAVVFSGHGKTYETTAFVQDGQAVADVPNFLLQKAGTFRVDLGWGLDCHMDCRTTFTVEAREKPDDYECNYNIKQRAEVSGGGVSSWNDLTDKPFYEETTTVGGDTLTWDGNTEGLATVGGMFFLVSEQCPTLADMPNGFIERTSNGMEQTWSKEQLQVVFEESGICAGEAVFIVYQDNFTIEDFVTFPKAGIYFVSAEGYADSLTIPGYTGFATEQTVVKPIDTKYLPEALQFGESENAVLLPPTQFVGGLIANALVALGSNIELVDGHTYTVNWNGVDYEAVCYMAQTSFAEDKVPVVGNPLPQGGADNGLPFVIGGNEQGVMAWPLDGSTGATVSIKGYHVKQIDPKYLPKVSDLDATWLAELKTALGISD